MVKRCPACGYNNRDDASFCSDCGASIGGSITMVPALKPVPSVRVVTPVSQGGPIHVPAPGQCFYHPNLPAVYVCNRCGHSICRDDSKAYMDLVLCPQCYQRIVPMSPSQQPVHSPEPTSTYSPQPNYDPPPMPPMPGPAFAQPMPPPYPMYSMSSPRSFWAFILAMISGLLVILNAAALLSNAFYSMWVSVFFWIPVLDASPQHGLIFAIGAIIGIILVIGSILMLLGYGTIGSIVVFPLAVLSLIIGGGFLAGLVLGVLAGILGMFGK